jgi:hypothetical protein
MDNEPTLRRSLLATWWAGLSPDQHSQILSVRWEPLPQWICDSMTAAGIPLLVIHGPDHPPRSYLPAEVENFLDRFGATGHMATH